MGFPRFRGIPQGVPCRPDLARAALRIVAFPQGCHRLPGLVQADRRSLEAAFRLAVTYLSSLRFPATSHGLIRLLAALTLTRLHQ